MSDAEKKPAWVAATILEEIARRAEPIPAIQTLWRHLDNLRADRFVPMQGRINDDKVVMSFFYRESLFQDIDGTLEEIVEWVRTGLGPDQTAAVAEWDGCKGIVIEQTHREKWIVEDVRELVTKRLLSFARALPS